MPKYKIIFNDDELDEVFDTEEEAKDYALYYDSCGYVGSEILHMSNPGDYDDDYESCDYEIIEID